jgi:hypothetical protein
MTCFNHFILFVLVFISEQELLLNTYIIFYIFCFCTPISLNLNITIFKEIT